MENLYFHHSHLRGPRAYPSSLLTTTQRDPNNSFSSSSANAAHQSSLSFKLGSSNLSRNPTNSNLSGPTESGPNDVPSADVNPSGASPSLLAQNVVGPAPVIDPSLLPPEINSLIPMNIDHDELKLPPLPATGRFPSPSDPNTNINSNLYLHPTMNPDLSLNPNPNSRSPRTPRSIDSIPTPPLPSTSSNSNPPTPSTPHLHPNLTSSQQHQPLTSTSTLPTTDTYGFASSSLTYDSFWSSHSTSSRSYRGIPTAMDSSSGGGASAFGDFPSGGSAPWDFPMGGEMGVSPGNGNDGGKHAETGKGAGTGGKNGHGGGKRRNGGTGMAPVDVGRVAAGREG